MTRSGKVDRDSIFITLEEYIRRFHIGATSAAAFEGSQIGSLWARRSEGTLQLTAEESYRYQELTKSVHKVLSPDDDLSLASIDSAVKDAIFAVVDIPGSRSKDVEVRIRSAMATLVLAIQTPAQEYECWIEVQGLDEDSLPATFSDTRFLVLRNWDLRRLTATARERRRVSEASDDAALNQFMEDATGRPVAIQCVRARDSESALKIAKREVQANLECLNFFGAIIPFNRASLRISDGSSGTEPSLRIASAPDGSFVHKPRSRLPWKYSLSNLRELQHPLDVAVERVETLRAGSSRSEVNELLFRAVRWVGRAIAESSTEDRFLYSMVGLECILTPRANRGIKRLLEGRIARVWNVGDDSKLVAEIGHYYAIRSNLVHDGTLEIMEDHAARIQAISLNTILRLLTCSESACLNTLDEWDQYLGNC